MTRFKRTAYRLIITLMTTSIILTACGRSSGSKNTLTDKPASQTDNNSSDDSSKAHSDNPDINNQNAESADSNSADNNNPPSANNSDNTTDNGSISDDASRFTVDYNTLSNISNDGINWGQGSQFDEYNRPVYAVNAQAQYEQYGAYFIMPQENKIYLTMDCGSSSTYAYNILDTLKAKGVKITFFVTLPFVENNPEIIQRMIDDGHTIGNHSVSHPAAGMFSLSIEEQISEVKTVHEALRDNYGYNMHLFRYPQGMYSVQSLALMQQMGYQSVFWSFAYVDYDQNNQPDRDYAIQKLTDRIHPGAIFLLHIDSSTNAEILGEFIDNVRSMGYEFGTIS